MPTRFTSSLLTWSSWDGASGKETPETFSGLFWTGQQPSTWGSLTILGNLDYVARGGESRRSGGFRTRK